MPRSRRVVALGPAIGAAVLILGTSAGCSGTPVGPATSPSPQPSVSSLSVVPTAEPSDAASIPSNGAALAAFGYVHGPLQTFSLPRSVSISASSDQASLVTAVLAAPTPSEVYAYLVVALPAAGYTITGRLAPGGATPTPTLAFTGHGWSGSFTGEGTTSAVTLRPSG